LSKWFTKRFAAGGKRMRRIGIVALARRLAIALWRYLEERQIPEGRSLNPSDRHCILLPSAQSGAS